ncbi:MULTISPECIES: amino acid ABC transporter permease [Methanoculleus]|jgi:polar amino acid transport system permease protein|uniref:Amino acid ABC transporter membrane protein 2, PAAT family n=1 Tax=Methanoculleus thermophilus TaxID=2200 RepID=A0A1G9AEZ9_9EURY|nr:MULTISPECIES: amino acid ABC transporter permease [Methanoculleus]NLN08898.1 amino acid ABC transporter permease [Methanoculleus thermophilus]SDK25916.1 amino acid ABC transporter membrane protein 2, PAAT family [Methanoculleus thermophilus]HQD26217.1 amino acid ABC transporter permease [Methanoculleus thermophilus]
MDLAVFTFDILLPALMQGLIVTLQLIACSAPLGLALGIGVAVGRQYGHPIISWLCKTYVFIIKGTPLLLLLFILYFGLPTIGMTLTAFTASVLGFILCNGAYNAEYVRGALISIKDGQMIAAQALGMTRWQAIRSVILPQALRRAIPGLSNEFIYLIKYSSLAYMITVVELAGAGKQVATKYFTYTESFAAVGIVYLVLVTITTVAVSILEKRVAVPGTARVTTAAQLL